MNRGGVSRKKFHFFFFFFFGFKKKKIVSFRGGGGGGAARTETLFISIFFFYFAPSPYAIVLVLEGTLVFSTLSQREDSCLNIIHFFLAGCLARRWFKTGVM